MAATTGLLHELATWQASRPQLAFKIGLSGPPGAGKSTLIESFGQYLLEQNKSLAVLTIDPSSPVTKGSLLGDKTRMQQLARQPNVFIRPSPAKSHLGGISEHTGKAISLCEAAGYDIILVESVGVGQSEAEIVKIVDKLVLVLPPASGDELQALKRGIFELADVILINKADGDLKNAAEQSKQSYAGALKLMGRPTPVLSASAKERTGFNALWQTLSKAMMLLLFIATGCAKSGTTTSELIAALQQKNPRIARQALVALTRKPDPKALEAIISYSERKGTEDRIAAILAIRQLNDKRAIPWLYVLSKGHLDESVQNAAAQALTFLENQDR